MIRVTVDYDGEQAAPEPVSTVIARYLRRSFSLADIAKRAAKGWLFGLIGLALGLVAGVYGIWVTPPTYTVAIGLLPVDSAGDISIGGDNSALGAFAGLLGMGGGPVPKFTRFVSSLNATNVAIIMDKKYDMVCRTYAGSCDRKTHKWKKNNDFDTKIQRIVANVAHLPDPDSPRTAKDLASYTASNVTFMSDRTTHILTLTMNSRDPKFAVFFLKTLVQATNDFIRQEDRSVIQPYVDYLNGKLAGNLNLTQHDALSSILLEQERRLMLTSVDVPYAASIQDGPNISIANNAKRMLAVDAFLGLIVGFGAGVLWNLRTRRKQARSRSWQQPY
jgi:hypothetical protein